jgi:hypothetical protein
MPEEAMSIMRNLAATMFGLSAVATVALLGVSPANAGCGGCSYGPPHVIYAPPVEAVFPPPPPPPVHVDFRYHRPHYCGCDYGVAPHIIDYPYIVEQGPVYSGPGITTVPTYVPPRHYYRSPYRYQEEWRYEQSYLYRPHPRHHHHRRVILRSRG